MAYTPPAAPEHLSAESRTLWRELTHEYELEPHELKTLRLALEALDRATQARKALRRKGLTYEDRFGAPHARPEVAIERDSRGAFARLMKELALPVEDDEVKVDMRSRASKSRAFRARAA
jgi:P27 family predicted phage terminase small subunit